MNTETLEFDMSEVSQGEGRHDWDLQVYVLTTVSWKRMFRRQHEDTNTSWKSSAVAQVRANIFSSFRAVDKWTSFPHQNCRNLIPAGLFAVDWALSIKNQSTQMN